MLTAAASVLAELLSRPWFRKLAIGGLLALAVLGAYWRYEHVVSQRDALTTQVEQLEDKNETLQRSNQALETVKTQTVERSKSLNSIKQKVYEAPAGDVPADIRAALSGLRERQSR